MGRRAKITYHKAKIESPKLENIIKHASQKNNSDCMTQSSGIVDTDLNPHVSYRDRAQDIVNI